MGSISIPLIECLVFSALIVAVDPVAVSWSSYDRSRSNMATMRLSQLLVFVVMKRQYVAECLYSAFRHRSEVIWCGRSVNIKSVNCVKSVKCLNRCVSFHLSRASSIYSTGYHSTIHEPSGYQNQDSPLEGLCPPKQRDSLRWWISSWVDYLERVSYKSLKWIKQFEEVEMWITATTTTFWGIKTVWNTGCFSFCREVSPDWDVFGQFHCHTHTQARMHTFMHKFIYTWFIGCTEYPLHTKL